MASLEEAVRDAVLPRSLRERVRLRWSGGWTASQVLERLPVGTVLPADATSQVAQRAAVDQVYRTLLALAEAGQLQRKKVTYTMDVNTKGPRDMLVDVFR